MGRAKIAMEFISKEKKRNTTYVKRKKGLLKKCYELSILCNVPVCIIIYPYKDGNQPLEAEVYAFREDTATTSTSPLNLGRARDPKLAREIIERYLKVSKEKRVQNDINLHDMFDTCTNALPKYYNSNIDGFNLDQLIKLLVSLDQKIDGVNQRISVIKGDNHHQAAVSNLVPNYIEPTLTPPISSFIIPEFIGGLNNQFALFDYPTIDNNNNYFNHHQEYYCNQIVPCNNHNQQNAIIPNEDQVIEAYNRMNDDHQDVSRSNNNLVMYNTMNMNMMGDVGPVYYDQRSVIADRIEATSSYGGSFPMLQPNVALTRQMQYEMYYKE